MKLENKEVILLKLEKSDSYYPLQDLLSGTEMKVIRQEKNYTKVVLLKPIINKFAAGTQFSFKKTATFEILP